MNKSLWVTTVSEYKEMKVCGIRRKVKERNREGVRSLLISGLQETFHDFRMVLEC